MGEHQIHCLSCSSLTSTAANSQVTGSISRHLTHLNFAPVPQLEPRTSRPSTPALECGGCPGYMQSKLFGLALTYDAKSEHVCVGGFMGCGAMVSRVLVI